MIIQKLKLGIELLVFTSHIFCLLYTSRDNPSIQSTDDLWYYFYGKVIDIAQKRGLYVYGWEEVAMRKTLLDGCLLYTSRCV